MKIFIFGIAVALSFASLSSTAETRCVKDAYDNITCRDTDTPSTAELRAIYGSGPEAYIQGMKQIEQSNLLQEQALQQKRLENQRAALANQYEAQNNALRLENQRLKNEALENKNRANQQTLANEDVQLTTAQLARVLRASDDEINLMISQAQKMSLDPDPATKAKGERLMQISKAAVKARQKQSR